MDIYYSTDYVSKTKGKTVARILKNIQVKPILGSIDTCI